MTADWELTATTIFCDDVADEVTIIVNGDGTVKCTGAAKYARQSKEAAAELKERSKKLGKNLSCKNNGCEKLPQYRDTLLGKK